MHIEDIRKDLGVVYIKEQNERIVHVGAAGTHVQIKLKKN